MKMRKLLCLVLSLLLVLSLAACGKKDSKEKENSYKYAEAVAEKFMEYFFDVDIEKIFDLSHPSAIDHVMQDAGMTKRSWKEAMKNYSDKLVEEFEAEQYCWSGSYEITDIINLNDYDEDAMESLLDYYDAIGLDIQEVKWISIQADLVGHEFTDWIGIVAIKVDNSWYLDIITLLEWYPDII